MTKTTTLANQINVPKIERIFHRYNSNERIAIAGNSTNRNGAKKKMDLGGEFYYWRSDIPNIAFNSRKQALGAQSR